MTQFCTAITCMDGRIQIPVNDFLRNHFQVNYVDTITEAGPNVILAEQKPSSSIDSILYRLKISIENHKSQGLAVIGHFDCAGNPVSSDIQLDHIKKAIHYLKSKYGSIKTIGLWVDKDFTVSQI